MKQNFELFMGCFGNGTTVYNKLIREHGEYKKVCHISIHGVIDWYVDKKTIPITDLDKILTCAEQDKAEFMERWNKKNYMEKWEYMMNTSTIGCGLNAFQKVDWDNKGLSMEERVKLMERVFFKTSM